MENILIVDDSTIQAMQLKMILKADYAITLAHSAEEGLAIAKSGDFALILLDVIMPGMDGFALLKQLQEDPDTQSVPVILITSLSDIESEVRGLNLGAVDYIARPFHPLIVQARVNIHIKLYQYRRQVEWQSMTDQLTGISNYRRYERYSIVKWLEACRLQINFSVCLVDVDFFRAYNDIFGHPSGDKVLAAVANAFARHMRRTTDFVARYSGETFVAISIGEGAQEMFQYMCRFREKVKELHLPHAPTIAPWVTVSIGGVTVVPRENADYRTYLTIAETMLHDAKRFGRNQVVWCGEGMKQLREK